MSSIPASSLAPASSPSARFDPNSADTSACMDYLRARLSQINDIITEFKRKGQTRNQTDFWFPIWKPSTRYRNKAINKYGEHKSEQISFSRTLGLSNEQAFVLISKVNRRWKKVGKFPFPITFHDDQCTEWILIGETSAGHLLPRQQVVTDDFPPWVQKWLQTADHVSTQNGNQFKGRNLKEIKKDDKKRLRDARMGERERLRAEKIRKCEEVESEYGKRVLRSGKVNSDVKHILCGREYILPCHYSPVLTSNYEKIKLENEDLKRKCLLLNHKISDIEMWLADYNRLAGENSILKKEIGEKEIQIAAMSQRLSNEQELCDEITTLEKMLEENKELYEIGSKFDAMKNINKCRGSPLAQRLYTMAWAQNPKSSADAMGMSIPCLVAAFLVDLDVIKTEEVALKIARASPSPTTLKSMLSIQRELVNKFVAELAKKGVKFCIAHDKGERCGLGRLVRELKYWCNDTSRVISIRVDADGTNADDTTVAEAIDHTLAEIEKYAGSEKIIKLIGAITDTGGGGTTESNAEELKKLDRCSNDFLVANCTFHAHSKSFQNAWEGVFGGGGLGVNTSLQFIHTAYSLQESFGEDFNYQWKKVTDTPALLCKMVKPVLTRWGYVGRSARKLLEHWEQWSQMMNHGYEKYTTKESTIGRNGLRQLHDKDGNDNLKLKFEIQFLVSFCDAYWDPHFTWLHRIDDMTKLSGHSSHELPLRVFIMQTELDNIRENWQTMPAFEDAANTLLRLNPDIVDSNGDVLVGGKETTLKQIEDYFRIYRTTFTKHFKRWRERLAPLVIASQDCRAVDIFAKWYLGRDQIVPADEVCDGKDEIHARTFKYKAWLEFLETSCTRELWLHNKFKAAIEKVANGSRLWDTTIEDEDISNLRLFARNQIFIIPHHTQSTEAGVQETSICGANQKGETDASNLVVVRSFDCAIVNQRTADLHQRKRKRGNQHVSSGIGSERQMKSPNSVANFEHRQSKKTKGRTRAPVGKYKMEETIKRAFELQFSNEEVTEVRKILKGRKKILTDADCANNNFEPTSGKALRLFQQRKKVSVAVDKWRTRKDRGDTNLKRAENVKGFEAMTLPLTYSNKFKISSFRLNSQKKYLIRELEVRGVATSGIETEGINALKKRLTELVHPEKSIVLEHPDNRGKYQEIINPSQEVN